MSVIIRLQGLSWTASASDIRTFFKGLSIPPGGVHIIGGEQGDAFIAFTSDEDARQAMRRNSGYICECPVQLLLSSKSEMQTVISEARSQSASAPEAQPPTLPPQQPPPAQQPSASEQPQSQQPNNRQQPNYQQYPPAYPNPQVDMYQKGPPQQVPPTQGYDAGYPQQHTGYPPPSTDNNKQPPPHNFDYSRQGGQPPYDPQMGNEKNEGNRQQYSMPQYGQEMNQQYYPQENDRNFQGKSTVPGYPTPQESFQNQYMPDQTSYPQADNRPSSGGQVYPGQQGYNNNTNDQQQGFGNSYRGQPQKPQMGPDGKPFPENTSRPDSRSVSEHSSQSDMPQPMQSEQLYQDRAPSEPKYDEKRQAGQGNDQSSDQWYEEQQPQGFGYNPGQVQDQRYGEWPPVSGGPPNQRGPPMQRGPSNTIMPPSQSGPYDQNAPFSGQMNPQQGGRPPPGTEPPYGSTARFGEVPPDQKKEDVQSTPLVGPYDKFPPSQPYGAPNQSYGAPNQPYGTPNQPYGTPNRPPNIEEKRPSNDRFGNNGQDPKFQNRPPPFQGYPNTQRDQEYRDEWQDYSEGNEEQNQSEYEQYNYDDPSNYNEMEQEQYDPSAQSRQYGQQFQPPNSGGFPPRGPRPQQATPQPGHQMPLLQTPPMDQRFGPPRNFSSQQGPQFGEQPPDVEHSRYPPTNMRQGPDADLRRRDTSRPPLPDNQRFQQPEEFQESSRLGQEDADFRGERYGARDSRRPPVDVDNRRDEDRRGRSYDRDRDYGERDRNRDWDRRGDRDNRRRENPDDYHRDRSRGFRDERSDRDRDRDRRDYSSSGRGREDRDQRSRGPSDQYGRDRERERDHRGGEKLRDEGSSQRDRKDPSTQPGILGAAPPGINLGPPQSTRPEGIPPRDAPKPMDRPGGLSHDGRPSVQEYRGRPDERGQHLPLREHAPMNYDDQDPRGLKRPHTDSGLPVTICVKEVPYRTHFRDVHSFFRGCEIAYNGIKFQVDSTGRRTGTAFIKFASPAACQRALEFDNGLMGNRYVKISTCSLDEFANAFNTVQPEPVNTDAQKRPRIEESKPISEQKNLSQTGKGPLFVQLSGLPMSVTKEEVRRFFSNARIAKNGTGINFEYDIKGRTTGLGYVEFENANEHQKALNCDGREMASRRIRITTSSQKDVDALLQRQQEILKKQPDKSPIRMTEKPPEKKEMSAPNASSQSQRPGMPASAPPQTNASPQSQRTSMAAPPQENAPPQSQRTGMTASTQRASITATTHTSTPPQSQRSDVQPKRPDMAPSQQANAPPHNITPPQKITPPHNITTPQNITTAPKQNISQPPSKTPQNTTQSSAQSNTNNQGTDKNTDISKSQTQVEKTSGGEIKTPNGEGAGDAVPRTPLPYYCVHVQCLPPFIVLKDVRDFFGGLEIVPRGIQIVYDSIGRPLGEAFVEFVTKTDCEKAVHKDQEVIANHTIRVKPISKVDMIDYLRQARTSRPPSQPPNLSQNVGQNLAQHPQQHSQQHGGPQTQSNAPYYARGSRHFYLRAHNLPFTISIREIMNFFQGFNPVEETIRVHVGSDPKSGGTTATLAFRTKEEADIAIKSLTGKFYRNKQISLSPTFMQILHTTRSRATCNNISCL